MRAGTSSEPIRAKTNTRIPGAAAHNSRCFLRFVGADDIPRSQLRQGLMTVRRRPPNARSSGLRPLKWFNLAPQPSTASSCHQMLLPISAVHHLPPAVPLRRSRWRVDAVARCHSTPVCSAAPARRPSVATADPVRRRRGRLQPGSKSRRLALVVQKFYRKSPP